MAETKNNRKKLLGFTLIELLVVIAIIGLLSSAIVVATKEARFKARDARRKSDMAEIRKALELYFLDNNGVYPRNGTVGNPNNETDIQALGSFLVPTYMQSIPNDPLNTQENYGYVWKDNGNEFAVFIPYENDGGTSCKYMTPNGNVNWFNKAPQC